MKCERCKHYHRNYCKERNSAANPDSQRCNNFLSTGTKPEPEQDERIKIFHKFNDWDDEDFNTKEEMFYSFCIECVGDDFSERATAYYAGYTSRNAEIEALKADYEEKIRDLNEQVGYLNGDIINLTGRNKAMKAEIESMRCCGNCQHLDYCEYHDNPEAEREINYPFDRCDNWKRKSE